MRSSLKEIPGPREVFLIGSIFRRFGSPLRFFEDISGRFGGMARFTLLGENFVLVSDPAVVEEILVEKHDCFHKGRALEQARMFLGNSVLVSEGAEHRRQRKLLQPAFHRERIAGYAKGMARLAEAWADQRKAGEELDMNGQMNRLTLEIVADTLFESTVKEDAKDVAESLTIVIENFNRLIMPFARFMRMLPTSQNRRIQEAEQKLNTTIYRIIRERRKSGEDRGDLLSMLLEARDAESEQAKLSDQEVRDQAMTLFLAGHETTANALAWTWHLLADDGAAPIRQRMLEEILEVIGKERSPGLEDAGKLVFTRAVMSESMRLYPPVWAMGRRVVKPVKLGGFNIPVKTIMVMSPYLIHRSGKYWKDPLEFRPERWLEPPDPTRPKFAYVPFGSGPRVCMGEAFAWTEGLIVLACLARRWSFEYVGEHAVPWPTVTLRQRGEMRMRVVAR